MMKCSIRSGVFETNSSSTHGVCVTDNGIYHDFLDGKLIVSSNITDEQLVKLGLDRNKSYDPDEISDRIENDKDFREALEIDKYYKVDMKSMKCSMKELMFYHGLWTLDGLKDSGYSYKVDRTESPYGEEIVVIGYYGWA